ncbi:MAG: glycosyltransferase family 4 protein [Flavobacteriales bacterium]|nr:glycosyltransferase family 4 protein [Flavobacteriales bacterium]
MKIAVNTRLLLKDQMDGIGYFTFESFKRLVALYPDDEFIFIFDRKPDQAFLFADNVKAEVIAPQARHPLLYQIWYQHSLKKLLKKLKPDLFVATDGMFPLKTDTKVLSIIHDINFHHHPEFLPKKYADFYNRHFKSFAEKATRIATVSGYSKQDIAGSYGIDNDKIDVVYNGANPGYIPLEPAVQEEIRERYAQGNPYFLFVGTLHPRKNLINLFRAFEQFKTRQPNDVKLLIVGRKMWWKGELENCYTNLTCKDDVVFTGRVSETELQLITGSALALTYVPFFEGFGIPLVEAMRCGTPVVASNTTSMPEVVEEAGILVNPHQPEMLCKAMQDVYSDPGLREKLTEKGLNQARKFSWDKTAGLLWESINKTIHA